MNVLARDEEGEPIAIDPESSKEMVNLDRSGNRALIRASPATLARFADGRAAQSRKAARRQAQHEAGVGRVRKVAAARRAAELAGK